MRAGTEAAAPARHAAAATAAAAVWAALDAAGDPLAAVSDDDAAEIRICGGSACHASGRAVVVQAFRESLAARGLGGAVRVVETGCHGFCDQGPIVVVRPAGVFYPRVRPEDADPIVAAGAEAGGVHEKRLYRDPTSKERVAHEKDIPFYALQSRRVLALNGRIDPCSLDDYLAHGGYKALARVLAVGTPDEVVETIAASGLRGRGGAGFTTGTKWRLTREAPGAPKYVVCNADEGDPGAFMDRSVLEGDPFEVLEGMTIAGFAIGAAEGYVYVRHEYRLAVERLRGAVTQARSRGLLGAGVLGTAFSFDVRVVEGAGAFVCGEETALLQSIEGQRGMPRPRPPYPAVEGLFGKPTNINNVETYANVPWIVNNGSSAFAAQGTPTSKGTKIFSLTGQVVNAGLVEVPMGTTLRQVIFDIGGGMPSGRRFKAVQLGGPSGGCLPESHLDRPIDFESLAEAGSMMGSGGMVVVDETTCMVDLARFFLQFTAEESCGKCVPCREGTGHLVDILDRICAGRAELKDLDRLEHLARLIKSTSLCGLGQTAPNPVLSSLLYFRDEFEEHITLKHCRAVSCRDLLVFRVIPGRCTGCQRCVKVCPTGAITGPRAEAHNLDASKCIKCRACYEVCRFDAIAGDAIVIESRGRHAL
ncbi:MAG TPA: NADH-quinone oxidoreductase subunit NuoF [Thermoleophilia bacterium]|nr:NADH-quinone oxidoreductase subunit NuoF [Thermoleophilia bacterium]